MFNPCDLAFSRTPKAPNLKEGGEITLETRAIKGELPPTGSAASESVRPAAADDSVLAAPNRLTEVAGDPVSAEAAAITELEGLTRQLLDLLVRNSPALDSALAAFAGQPNPEPKPLPKPFPKPQERLVTAMGGRLGRVAAGDDLRLERGGQTRRPPLPPQATTPVEPPVDLAPPIEPAPVEPEKLAAMPAPPTPKPLEPALQETLSTPWTFQEGEWLRHAAPAVTGAQIRAALRHLDELERFVGGELRMATDRTFNGFQVSNRAGFVRLVALGYTGQTSPVGAHLVDLHAIYRAYKQDYYGLMRARRALLDRRDPAALDPLLSEEELQDYLWRKYGEALRGRLWRLLRSSAHQHEDARATLGSDRPWQSGGSEPSFELVQSGLFVALESEEGDFEIQKEQGNPWSAQGTYNLAVAVRLGQDVVAYDVRSGVLKINGRVVPWGNGVYELPEGARLELGDERMQLVSLRGDSVAVELSGRTLVLSGTVSGDRLVDSVRGALGAFGAEEPRAMVARDGRRVARVGELLDSWKVPTKARLG